MARVKIVWTNTAINQRNNIFEYWNDRNKSTSFTRKLNSKIKERLFLVQPNPYLGKATSFKESRAISLGNYSIIYQTNESQIIVTAFWDNRQDPKKLMEILKKKL
jgi:plasmid stabilization system protein ParE